MTGDDDSRLISPSVARALAFSCLAIVVIWSMLPEGLAHRRYFSGVKQLEGDEPSYLRMAHSLLTYGTLDLTSFLVNLHPIRTQENIDALRASGSGYAGNLLFFGRNGAIHSLHMPGVSLLILAPYAADTALSPADQAGPLGIRSYLPQRMTFTFILFLIVALLNIHLLLRLLLRQFTEPLVGALLTTIFILNSPFLGFSFKIYPECFALLLTLLALNGILFPFRRTALNLAAVTAGIGLMPWLHQRFIVLSAGLWLLLVLVEFQRKGGPKKTLALSGALALIGISYLGYFYLVTGSPSPLSTAGLYGRSFFNIRALPLGCLGYLFSRPHGIAWFYPWLALFIFGLYRAFRDEPKQAVRLLAVFLPYYLVASCAIQHQITRPEGRYLLALFPVLIIFSGYALDHLVRNFGWKRALFYALFVGLFLLNRYTRFLDIGFHHRIRHLGDWWQVAKSAILVALMVLSLHLSERHLFPSDRKYRCPAE